MRRRGCHQEGQCKPVEKDSLVHKWHWNNYACGEKNKTGFHAALHSIQK